MFYKLFCTLITLSAIVCHAASPPFRFTYFHDDAQGQTKVPGQFINLAWQFDGDTAWDSCFLAIRPMSDLQGDDSYIVGAHPQCGASSASLQIPREPFNKRFAYNGSLFVVRLNTPYGTFADGNPFFIAQHYEEPWSRADKLARGSLAVSIAAVVITVGVAFIPIVWEWRSRKRHGENEGHILQLQHDTTLLQRRVSELIREAVQREGASAATAQATEAAANNVDSQGTRS